MESLGASQYKCNKCQPKCIRYNKSGSKKAIKSRPIDMAGYYFATLDWLKNNEILLVQYFFKIILMDEWVFKVQRLKAMWVNEWLHVISSWHGKIC